MRKLPNIRIVNEYEKSIIQNTLSKILQNSDVLIQKIQNRLYISFDRTNSKVQHPSVYLVSTDHPDFIRNFEPDIQITSAGLYFGFFKEDSFRLSLEGAEFLVNHEYLTQVKILTIDGNGEKSILYGNDIKRSNVINFPANLRKGDFFVIKNENDEICAIAKSLISKHDFTRLKPRDKIAFNLVDKGYYLRKNQ